MYMRPIQRRVMGDKSKNSHNRDLNCHKIPEQSAKTKKQIHEDMKQILSDDSVQMGRSWLRNSSDAGTARKIMLGEVIQRPQPLRDMLMLFTVFLKNFL